MPEKIQWELLSLVAAGVYQSDDRLPDISALCAHYAVNPRIVTEVYERLEQSGLVYALPGQGYYVAPEKEKLRQYFRDAFAMLLPRLMEIAKWAEISDEEFMTLYKKRKDEEHD